MNKKTVFFDNHKALGARIVPFAGYEMPVEYTGVIDEHLIVRSAVGVFDVSHMGEIWIKGSKSLELIQKITSNDASKLITGKVQYSCLPNGNGGIVDDLLVYQYDELTYLLVVNAANIDKDWAWINSQNSVGADLENASDQISQLAIQGPRTIESLQKLTSTDLSQVPYYSFIIGDFAGVKDVIISNTGYTGESGFELYFNNIDGQKIWDAIFESGKDAGIKPIGLAARDTLRLEMGYCLYGNDIDDHTSPIEAGLGWITKFADGKNFIDRELLYKQKNNGVTRKLVGFKMVDKAIPRHNYEIFNENTQSIGFVTSGTMSPSLKIGIGLGYVKTDDTFPGNRLYIKIRDKLMVAVIVKMPFYNK